MADSLARYYNSQLAAHIGYAITSAGVVLATFLATWFSVAWPFWMKPPVPPWVLVLSVLMWDFLFVYFLGDFVPYSLPYFYGRAQYYLALSEIAWLCMGLRYSPNAKEGGAIKARTVELGLINAVLSVFQARLFVSRCCAQKPEEIDKQISENLGAFDIKTERNGISEQNLYLGRGPFYRGRLLGVLDKHVDLLYYAYRSTIEDYLRREDCPEGHREHRIGRLLSLDFKQQKCAKCGKSV